MITIEDFKKLIKCNDLRNKDLSYRILCDGEEVCGLFIDEDEDHEYENELNRCSFTFVHDPYDIFVHLLDYKDKEWRVEKCQTIDWRNMDL